jgi:hypothetical protein
MLSPPRLSQARTSYPPKCFPPNQLNCVTTVVSFSPLFLPAVSSAQALDLKALLCSGVRCRSPMLPSDRSPILPWALFPFKALPSYSDALPKSSGASPPKRRCSGPRPPKRPRPGCCLHRSASSTSRSLSIPTVVQPKLPPATNLTPVCPVRRPADRSQPALELFERPLIRFSLLPCRLRWSPAWLPPALQRSFRDEVALISRVFSFLNRSS